MVDVNAIEQELLHGVRRGDDSPPRRDSFSSTPGDDETEGASIDEGEDEHEESAVYDSSKGAYSGHNTGVKGVRNDARRHEEAQRALKEDQVRATNKRMQGMALGRNRTWKEDDEDRGREAAAGLKAGQEAVDSGEEDEELKEIRQRRLDTLKSQAASNEARRRRLAGEEEPGTGAGGVGGLYGHLREVGADQYAHAIDGEVPDVFVVVHIYVKHVHACAQLTAALSSLARVHTSIKFIQVRAGSIGFGSKGKDDLEEAEADEEAEQVVPTLLAYKAGRLLVNLVRVDLEENWGEGAERNVRDILVLHGLPL